MMIASNYRKATNAAYELLCKHYSGVLPVIDVKKLVEQMPNIKIHTYSEVARKLNMSFEHFAYRFASSEYGYTIKQVSSGNNLIFINDLKDEKTIRFSIAHELGHIILNHAKDTDTTDREANCFARNLLCPIQISDGFNVQTIQEYVNCFGISEPMAETTISYRKSDEYYITQENYQKFNDKVYCYFSGCTLAELYG